MIFWLLATYKLEGRSARQAHLTTFQVGEVDEPVTASMCHPDAGFAIAKVDSIPFKTLVDYTFTPQNELPYLRQAVIIKAAECGYLSLVEEGLETESVQVGAVFKGGRA